MVEVDEPLPSDDPAASDGNIFVPPVAEIVFMIIAKVWLELAEAMVAPPVTESDASGA